MSADILPLIWYQETLEKVLKCTKCDDVCWYQYPKDMKTKMLKCDYCCKIGGLTDNIPKGRRR